MEPTFTLWLWRDGKHRSIAWGETINVCEQTIKLMAGTYPPERFVIIPDGVMPSVYERHPDHA